MIIIQSLMIMNSMNYKEKYYKHHNLEKCDLLYCAVCGRIAVNLHHIVYKSQGGTDEPSNLISLCMECHDGHHTRNEPSTNELLKLKNNE